MPSGTGKTVSLLSLIVSYMQVSCREFHCGSRTDMQYYPTKRKLIYCSRTVPEIEKALAELKRLMEYRMEMGAKDEDFRGMGLTSRKNLCLHPEVRGSPLLSSGRFATDAQVSKEKKGKMVDSRCRDLTSAFACEKGRADPGSVPLCSFHEVNRLGRHGNRADLKELNNYEPGNLIPAGVYTLDDVKRFGQEKGTCPYFTIRRMVSSPSIGLPPSANVTARICRYCHLLLSLPARSEGRGECIGRDEQREHSGFRRSSQYW